MNKRSSFTVEAAMLFPIFILLWIPFFYLIRYCILYEALQEVTHQTATVMSTAGYLFQRSGLKAIQDETGEKIKENKGSSVSSEWRSETEETGELLYKGLSYCERILDSSSGIRGTLSREGWKIAVHEVGDMVAKEILGSLQEDSMWQSLGIKEDLHIEYSEFFYTEADMPDWISIVVFVPLHWPDPFGLFTDRTIAVSSQVRAFIGLATEAYEEKKDEEQGEQTTYYRIGNGRRYHSLDCYLIQKEVRMMTREEAVQQGYMSCEHCTVETEMVWVTLGGKKYHTNICSHLFPKVEPLSEQELLSGRYQPCAICQTDGGWFS